MTRFHVSRRRVLAGTGAVAVNVIARAGPVYWKGRKSVNVLPCPGALTSLISPPSSVASSRLMARPRPVPPYFRLVPASAWLDQDDVQIVENAPLTIAKDFSNPGNDPVDTPEETVTAGSTGNTFFIIVTNTGTSTADNVVIADVVPSALTVTNVSGTLGSEVPPTGDNNIQWLIPTLNPGQTGTTPGRTLLPDGAHFRSVNNTATADSD